jgi:hypothetical protein
MMRVRRYTKVSCGGGIKFPEGTAAGVGEEGASPLTPPKE